MNVNGSPRYLQLAHEIETRIRSGGTGRRLPSLRELAEEHGVSVATASRAIEVLRGKGLIGRTDRSGCYLVGERRGVERWGLYLHVTPGSWQKVSGSVSRVGFDAVARQGEAEFTEPFDLREGTTRRELQAQARKAVEASVGGVFFLPARRSEASMRQDEQVLQACDAEGLPVVLLDRNLRGHWRALERDLVGVDDLDGAVRCTRHLLEVGRRRIALVVGSPCSSHDDRVAGYLGVLRAASDSGEYPGLAFEPRVLELPPDLPSKEADRWLADRLVQTGVDGVFCYQDSVAIGVILELLARGVAVPTDVAVVGFDNLPIGDLFTIGVTTYSYPSEAIAQHALRIMRLRREWPAGPPVKVSVPGELIVRESTVGSSAGVGGR
jgi:LacI family transcriptional regulator